MKELKPDSRIPDEDIPGASPDAVVRQYRNLVYKIATGYQGILSMVRTVDINDLTQEGFIGLLDAQKSYHPDKGSFTRWSAYYIRGAMRKALGIGNDGNLPPDTFTLSLDAPISEDEDISLMETVKDPNSPIPEEVVTEAEERETISSAVRDAVQHMKSEKQREAIQRIWIEEQDRNKAAEEMGISYKALTALDKAGRTSLSRNPRLQEIYMPDFKVGVNSFRSTWTSAVEKAVIWLEEHENRTRNGEDHDKAI